MNPISHYLCRPSRWLALALAAACLAPSSAQAEEVTVYTREGGRITGQVDARSNDRQLWLRIERPGITMLRSFDRGALQSIETVPPAPTPNAAGASKNPTSSPPQVITLRGAPRTEEESARIALAHATEPIDPLGSIAIEANVANWNASVENDGILLTLYPIDRSGQVIPIDATLEVELVGEGPGNMGAQRTFPTLGRWVRAVRAAEFGAQAYQFRLEWQTRPPDFDGRLGNFGLVHARLAAPGHGTFDATAPAVTLRAPSPMRDRLQQRDNWRFFPNENTGYGQQQQPQVPGL